MEKFLGNKFKFFIFLFVLNNLLRRAFAAVPVLSVSEPELVRQILVKDFPIFINRLNDVMMRAFDDPLFMNAMFHARDEKWKRLRSIVSPTFTSGKIRSMIPLLEECYKSLDSYIEKRITSGDGKVELSTIFGNLTMDVICRAAFATKTNTHEDPNNPFVYYSRKVFRDTWRMITIFFPKFIRDLFGFHFLAPDTSQFFTNTLNEIIKKRLKEEKKFGKNKDFLQLLLDTRSQQNTSDDTNDANNDKAGMRLIICCIVNIV